MLAPGRRQRARPQLAPLMRPPRRAAEQHGDHANRNREDDGGSGHYFFIRNVFAAAYRGSSHATNGWPWMDTLVRARSRTAQCSVFAAFPERSFRRERAAYCAFFNFSTTVT
jgi:hypothetical protein